MTCNEYILDTSAIDSDISKIRDGNIKKQLQKKLIKIKYNPRIGEKKKFELDDEYVVKINGQRSLLFYHIDEEKCTVILDLFDRHDQGYRRTY